MTRRATVYVLTLLLMTGVALFAPALGWASSGGSGLSGSGATTHAAGSSSGTSVGSGNATVSATGNGITIRTRAATLLRNRMTVAGQVPASAAGRTIEVQRLGPQTHWRWAATSQSVARVDGSFTAVWPTNHIGRFSIRAIVLGSQAQSAAASPTVTVTIYRPSVATVYGPGFWGSRTACGQTLTRHTLGVANRTLPCGTRVAILYQGRTIVVPVIDRGPYANGADWDLTEAMATTLGISGTVTLGAVSLHSR